MARPDIVCVRCVADQNHVCVIFCHYAIHEQTHLSCRNMLLSAEKARIMNAPNSINSAIPPRPSEGSVEFLGINAASTASGTVNV